MADGWAWFGFWEEQHTSTQTLGRDILLVRRRWAPAPRRRRARGCVSCSVEAAAAGWSKQNDDDDVVRNSLYWRGSADNSAGIAAARDATCCGRRRISRRRCLNQPGNHSVASRAVACCVAICYAWHARRHRALPLRAAPTLT